MILAPKSAQCTGSRSPSGLPRPASSAGKPRNAPTLSTGDVFASSPLPIQLADPAHPTRGTRPPHQLRLSEHLHRHDLRMRLPPRPHDPLGRGPAEPNDMPRTHVVRVQQRLVLRPPVRRTRSRYNAGSPQWTAPCCPANHPPAGACSDPDAAQMDTARHPDSAPSRSPGHRCPPGTRRKSAAPPRPTRADCEHSQPKSLGSLARIGMRAAICDHVAVRARPP